jgi:ribosomal subunit interface protein
VKVQIRDTSFEPSNRLQAHLQRRVDMALDGLGQRVSRIVVRLSRAVPERGGSATRCDIEVALRPRNVRAEETDVDLFLAVDKAARHLQRAVGRALAYERAWKDDQPRPVAPGRRARRAPRPTPPAKM